LKIDMSASFFCGGRSDFNEIWQTGADNMLTAEVEFQYGGRLFFSKPEIVISQLWIELYNVDTRTTRTLGLRPVNVLGL